MKKWTYLITILFVGLFVGLALFLNNEDIGFNNDIETNDSNVPSYVIEVLHQVQTTGKTFDGYVGGRTFQNREQLLPKKEADGRKIKYKEWDVHRKIKGKNRGAERLVTGSDENAYYTKDHYRSFIKIQE